MKNLTKNLMALGLALGSIAISATAQAYYTAYEYVCIWEIDFYGNYYEICQTIWY